MNAWLTKLDPKAHTRWIVISFTFSLLAMAGMIISAPDIDGHPVTFATSLTWVIGGFTGLFAQKFLLQMDPWRFRFRRWEREGRVYRWVGVNVFRWMLQHTPLGWLNPAMKMTIRRSSLKELLRQMNFAEGAHLIGGVITLGLSVGFFCTSHRSVGLVFVVITLLVHFYPLVTQRWNRGRVARMVRRQASRSV
ncbi:MAG: hypothetical protein V4662_17290 [Verrucomicrobiota bacterium]